MEEGYNGYTNHATWNICLWLDNDPTLQNRASNISNSEEFDYEFKKDDAFEAFVYETLDVESLNPMQQDAINGFLGQVNWKEVTNHFKDEE